MNPWRFFLTSLTFSLFFLIGFIVSASPIMAATTTSVEQRYASWQTPTIEQSQTDALNKESISSTSLDTRRVWDLFGISGMAMFGPVGAAQAVSPGATQGAIGAFGNLISNMTTQPPVKAGAYIADLGNSLGFATPAYAQQGTGFRALEPALPIWKAFRNIAYFGFVIIFVVIGFMIMFRAKINPQTAISIQASLPQIVVTLLLVTFSYAIAAFMVDLIYLLIYLIVGTFAAFGIIADAETARNVLLGKSVFGIAFQDMIWFGHEGTVWSAADAVAHTINGVLGSFGGAVANIIAAPLAYVIFAVAILIAVFRLFFTLLLAYVGIIFGVIFSPITLLFNALPGSKSFIGWLKGLLANALVFPVTALMFLVSGALLGSERFGVTPGIGYDPTGGTDFAATQLPFVGGGVEAGAIQGLIGIGFLMMMPKILEIVQKMLGVEGGFAGMAQAALEPVAGAWGATGGAALSAYWQQYQEAQQFERQRRILFPSEQPGKPPDTTQ